MARLKHMLLTGIDFADPTEVKRGGLSVMSGGEVNLNCRIQKSNGGQCLHHSAWSSM